MGVGVIVGSGRRMWTWGVGLIVGSGRRMWTRGGGGVGLIVGSGSSSSMHHPISLGSSAPLLFQTPDAGDYSA